MEEQTSYWSHFCICRGLHFRLPILSHRSIHNQGYLDDPWWYVWAILGAKSLTDLRVVVTLAEASSKALLGSSVASSVRPRRYYKIPKETFEASLDDLENFINFFVIEGQRIVFAENIPVTAAVSGPHRMNSTQN